MPTGCKLGIYGRLTTFAATFYGADPEGVQLEVKQLRGGLVSTAVGRVRTSWVDHTGRDRSAVFVVKRSDVDGETRTRCVPSTATARGAWRCAPVTWTRRHQWQRLLLVSGEYSATEAVAVARHRNGGLGAGAARPRPHERTNFCTGISTSLGLRGRFALFGPRCAQLSRACGPPPGVKPPASIPAAAQPIG